MKKWSEQKENLIVDIIHHLILWDRSEAHAIQILSVNDQKFKSLEALDRWASEEELRVFNEKHSENWRKIIKMQTELMQVIEAGQRENQEQLTQIDNKDKVVLNYMAVKNRSIFIEKNF